MAYLMIAALGIVGVFARFGVSEIFKQFQFPIGTLTVNLVGSFLVGLIYRWQPTFSWGQHVRVAAIVGFLGGLTTFSSFTLDVLRLIENDRILLALVYLMVSVAFGIFLCWLGMWVSAKI